MLAILEQGITSVTGQPQNKANDVVSEVLPEVNSKSPEERARLNE